jgi:hypothetical protein
MALPNRKRTSSVRACSNPSEAKTERHKTSKWSMSVSTSTSGSAKNHRLHTAVTPTPRTPGHADHNLHSPIVRACAPCICRLPNIFFGNTLCSARRLLGWHGQIAPPKKKFDSSMKSFSPVFAVYDKAQSALRAKQQIRTRSVPITPRAVSMICTTGGNCQRIVPIQLGDMPSRFRGGEERKGGGGI